MKIEFKNEDAMNRVVEVLWNWIELKHERARWRSAYAYVRIRR
ncbi:hypothetical protein N9H17_06270 [Schleiferiaceae bacterium]|nr:hypothetical protein [Schleiferiaceae bacterium]